MNGKKMYANASPPLPYCLIEFSLDECYYQIDYIEINTTITILGLKLFLKRLNI